MRDPTSGSTRSQHRPTHNVRRKNMNIDQAKLDRAVAHLGARSETDAIDRALDLVLFSEELIDGIERLTGTGGVENYFDDHPDW